MKFKFYIALWGAKFHLFLMKLIGNRQDDKSGILALKICDNFLDLIKKPNLVVAVTGTNGKTTVSNMLAEILIKDGKKVVYNDWGANTRASSARCLLDAVTIFNKVKVDAAVLETDELTSCDIFPYVKPNYILVTNLFRDSMHRNAHPLFVFNKINDYIPTSSTLVLNADDIISGNLGENNKKVLYSIKKQDYEKEQENIVVDMRICPKCHSILNYDFRRYHHIGKVSCPNCNFKSPSATFIAEKVDLKNKKMEISYNNEKDEYNLSSDSLFNAYNTLSIIALLRDYGMDNEKIKTYLEQTEIVKSRYSTNIVNGIEVSTIAAKGIVAIAVARVCDYIRTLKGNIEIIMVIDDTFDNQNGSEAIAWIYDVDFEFLNKDNITRIIVGGVRSKDYLVRLLLAGIPKEKIICVEKEQDTYKYLSLKNTDKVLILHEVYYITGAMKIKENVEKKILNDVEAKHED